MKATKSQEMDVLISVDDFIEAFAPIANPLDSNTGLNGCLFEATGLQLDMVSNINEASPDRIWTVVCIDSDSIIIEGFKPDDAIGFIITDIPRFNNGHYSVVEPDRPELNK